MTTSIAATITTTASICGVIITMILMIGTILGGDLKEKVYRWFFIALLFNTIGSSLEALVVPLIGMPGETYSLLFQIVDFFSYAFGSLTGIAYGIYAYEYLSLKKTVAKAPFLFVILCLCANIILIGVGQLTGRFVLLDANNSYNPQGLTLLAQILPALTLLTLILITLYHIKILKAREWISLLSYVILPLLCYGFEYLFVEYPLWISYFGIAVALLLVYMNIQVELRHTLIERDAELAESRMSMMLSQIKPHFLYNSLTAIGKLCDTDPKKARIAVNDFADYLRGNLESLGIRKQVYFADELEHVETYLSLEQLRFGKRLQVKFDISVEDFVLPPLTVQPLVENAVHHGITQRKEEGLVCISTKQTKEAVSIIVTDNGVGFDPSKEKEDGRSHIGIENVRGRLSAMCGGALEITSVPSKGTTAVITIPNNVHREVF
ncbi:histidine kinase [Lachnospiraceae bacterium OttesenSCG-928-D06]|nr:histidine kinase [Lachnospiraceae bacterium OttesenSCG-928-D06]